MLHHLRAAIRTLAVFVILSAAVAVSADPKTAEIDAIFADLDATSSPGCSVGVFRDDQLIFEKGYGMASLELGVPNSPETVFYIGSTSKQFVAASIVIAAREGHLSLDDDIRKTMTELPDYGKTITIRHLIHHTSGIRDYLTLMFLAGKPFENVYSNEWTIDLIARQKALNFTPGERHLYSNSGYYLLAQIVERATGKSLREYADEKIFKPLGMVHTHFHDDRGLVVRNRAMAYEPGDEGEFRLDWYPNFDKVGSGGLLTTVEDLLLWDRAFYSGVLGDGFVDQMLERGKLSNGEMLDYAFGLTRGEVRGLATVSHGGAFMGFRAELLRFPEQHLSVACLCNLGSTNPSAMAREVASLYLADVMEPEEKARSGEDEPEEETIERTKAELEPLTGRYWSAEEGLLREIRLEDGTLMYVRTEESKSPLGPRADGSFRMLEVPVRVDVRFEPSTKSPERMVVMVEGDDPTELVRVEPASRTIEELSAYAGHYYSEELDAEYVIRLGNGSLQIASGPLEVERLEPVSGETFTVGTGSSAEFVRSGDGDVVGFTLDAGRVRGLGFVRRND